jgi:hypothetical protein
LKDLKTRLALSVKINANDCWVWQRSKLKKGYGKITIGSKKFGNRKNALAHRISYEIFVGPIPKGLQVCHDCDNPSCINPDHLFLGTNQDNVDDKQKKGRIGVFAVINEHKAALIKRDLLVMKQKDVSLKHNIAIHIVKDISSGRSWKNVAI